MLLNMSVASHCPLLESAVEPLKDKLEDTIQDSFTSPVVSMLQHQNTQQELRH